MSEVTFAFTNLMRKDIKLKFPRWVEEDNGNDYQLCASDDIDSWLSVKVLERHKGYRVNYFYSFDKFYVMDTESQKQAIGVDIALMKGKCWDNHITMLSSRDSVNEQSANLNAIFKINRANYTEKYAGSTLLQIWSYYGIPLPDTDEGKMILLAIDSTYKGNYISKFKETQNAYLKMLGMEALIVVQEKYSQMDFQRITSKYRLNQKIQVNETGQLETDIDLEAIGEILGYNLRLPKKVLTLKKSFKSGRVNMIGKNYPTSRRIHKNIFSLAVTSQNNVSYSTL